jgi:hypothetical protein
MAGMSDEEMAAALAGTPPVAARAAGPSGPLSDEDMANAGAHAAPMGTGEAAARLFYKHLTFGTEPGADKELSKTAAAEHPYVDYGVMVPAMVAQTAALGPLAAAGKGVQVAANAPKALQAVAATARGAGKAIEVGLLPNTEARTALTAARTGAKLGGNYSALEAAGSDLTDPTKSLTDTARDVAVSYGAGTVGGGVLGVAAHGAGRLVGAAANRTMPQLREAVEAARAPEAQGVRDIARHAKYDDADLVRLHDTLTKAQSDPALAARYADLNVLEALKAGELKPTSAGELKPEVVTTRNLDDLAKHAANTEGRGQNLAQAAFASRKNEMSAKMQGDIDQFFGTANREGDAAAVTARREAVGKRYNKLRDSSKLVQVDELGRMQQVSPVFDKALRYAAENDAISNPGSQWGTLWSGGKLGQTVVTLSPSNMLDIHHALVMNAKPPIGGATPESVMAGRLKSWFTKWADDNFAKHKGLREDYAQLRRVMDATEKGADLPLATGGRDHASLKFLEQQMADLRKAEDAFTRKNARIAMAAQAGASARSLSTHKGQATRLAQIVQNRQEVLEEFRKAWGEAIKQGLAQRGDLGPSQMAKALTTQEGKRRILAVLGPEKGRAFIESLYNKDLQTRLGNTLYGGSDTAFKQQKRETLDALTNAASGILHMRPMAVWDATRELAQSAYRQKRADRVNELMSQQGVENVLPILKGVSAQDRLRRTGEPYVRNPLLRSLPGPVGAVGNVGPLLQPPPQQRRREQGQRRP